MRFKDKFEDMTDKQLARVFGGMQLQFGEGKSESYDLDWLRKHWIGSRYSN
jgi:hypothetical protein